MQIKTNSILFPKILGVFVYFLALDGIILRILTSEIHPFLIVFYRSLFNTHLVSITINYV
jgi:hypothetical protein